MNIDNIARQYLATKAARDAADLALKGLEEQLKGHMHNNGIPKLHIDGRTITFVEVARREFDVEALKNLVSRSIFSQVTEPKVKTSRMDALVELGKIQENVVDQVTKTNYYQQLRVK